MDLGIFVLFPVPKVLKKNKKKKINMKKDNRRSVLIRQSKLEKQMNERTSETASFWFDLGENFALKNKIKNFFAKWTDTTRGC